jgi:serine/threonine-protein kinase
MKRSMGLAGLLVFSAVVFPAMRLAAADDKKAPETTDPPSEDAGNNGVTQKPFPYLNRLGDNPQEQQKLFGQMMATMNPYSDKMKGFLSDMRSQLNNHTFNSPDAFDQLNKKYLNMESKDPRAIALNDIARCIAQGSCDNVKKSGGKIVAPSAPTGQESDVTNKPPLTAPSQGNTGSISGPTLGVPPPQNQGSNPAGFGGQSWVQNYANNNPSDKQALGGAGVYLFRDGQYQQAYQMTTQAVEAGSTDPNVLVAKGGSAYQLGDKAEAQRDGELALQIDPDNEAAQRLAMLSPDHVTGDISSVLKGVGFKEGGASMGSAGQDNARASTNFFGSGGVNAGEAGNSHLTAEELAAIATRQSQVPASNVAQSAALTQETASKLAIKDYQSAYNLSSKAIELNEQNVLAWNYRAIADTRLQKFDDAVHDASFAVGLVPGNADALVTRSWAFAKQGKYKEALADANFTLEKYPQNGFAYQSRAYALAGMGDRDAALEAMKQAAQLNPMFRAKYARAEELSKDSDLMFLFDDAPAANAAAPASAPASPGSQRNRFLRLFALCISGGLLVALGLLHIVSASWRDRIQTTIRRVIGGAPEAVAAEAPVGGGVADLAGGPSGGFWTQYQVTRQIGTGGMGIVYEAKDLSLERSVAIKKMRDEIRTDPAERQRFVTEARTVAALHHPNIVDIYSIIEDEQDVYLVFEYVPGKTLASLISEKGTLDFDAALKVLRGACEAVDYAHRQKVIHRDIKPSNIMVSDDGRVKVMDFGVARQAKDAMTKMSMTNTVVGTPPYMAPEQEQGSVRKESDVFGLGVVFYELLTGKLPFNGHGAGMLLNKINGRLNPLSEQVKYGLPKGLEDVIAKSLAPDPEKRYKTPAEFLAAVEAVGASRHG